MEILKEMPALVRSLKSSILRLTSSQMDQTFWGVVSAVLGRLEPISRPGACDSQLGATSYFKERRRSNVCTFFPIPTYCCFCSPGRGGEIEFLFSETSIDVLEEVQLFTPNSFVAEVGGFLGLLLGASIYTMAQMAERVWVQAFL